MNDDSLYTPYDKALAPSAIAIEPIREVELAIAAFTAAAAALQQIANANEALVRAGYALAFAGHNDAMATACELADFATDFRAELVANETFRVHARATGALRTAGQRIEEQ
jgi:hypothetical protein